MLPSVRFLKPIGIERPEPSWRWVWLSEVRAPIAPQATVSEMYCGVIGSRNSQPTGSPRSTHLEQQLAGDAQAGVDVAGAVQVRVVDQALPAGRRPRLLEVDPHHDQQPVVQLLRLGGEAAGVVERRLRVVDAAGPDHDQQPRVLAVEHVDHFFARLDHGFRPLRAERQLLQQLFRRRQLDHFRDPLVPHTVSLGALLHPDDHFAVAFLQTVEIVLSGRWLSAELGVARAERLVEDFRQTAQEAVVLRRPCRS